MLKSLFKLRQISSIIIFLLLIFSCSKDNTNVPDVYVNFNFSIYDPGYTALQFPHSYIYVTGGAYDNGIIIYRGSRDEFFAYDRTCTYDPGVGKVIVDESWGNQAVDTICGSRFLLGSESVLNGPATHFLKKYRVSFNSYTGLVSVYN